MHHFCATTLCFSPFFFFSFISFDVFIYIWSFLFCYNYVLIFYSFVFLFIYFLVAFDNFCILHCDFIVFICKFRSSLFYFIFYYMFVMFLFIDDLCALNTNEVSIVEYLSSTSNTKRSYSFYIHGILYIRSMVMDQFRVCNICGPQSMVFHYVYML